MNKKEWKEHCEWLNSFRGRIIRKYDENGQEKKEKEKEDARAKGRTLPDN